MHNALDNQTHVIYVNCSANYKVYIGSGLLTSNRLVERCRLLAHQWVIICDEKIKSFYADHLSEFLSAQGVLTTVISFPAGEIHKTRETKQGIEDEMLRAGVGRDGGVIALGGGVTLDLAGFVAATYCRGIPAIYLPTSLLAMVDASVGGKTGVNTPFGKNLIGAFKQPAAVLIDPMTLATLSESEFYNGMGEVIKHALLFDSDLIGFLKGAQEKVNKRDCETMVKMIAKNVKAKAHSVEQDEFEQGPRALLNFGHTIGHALEALSNYRLSHGQAVLHGILLENEISHHLGYLSKQPLIEMRDLVQSYLIEPCPVFDNERLIQALIRDKKSRAQKPRFVLLQSPGKPLIIDQKYSHEVSADALASILNTTLVKVKRRPLVE